jgi:hypothetical protein
VDLLEHLVDVDLVGLGLGLPALAGATLGGLLGGLLVGLLGTGRGGWDVSRSAGGVGVAFGRGVAGGASSSQRVIPESREGPQARESSLGERRAGRA